ncbi:MAG: sensor histidine kinase [Parasphingorhabdus sp.]
MKWVFTIKYVIATLLIMSMGLSAPATAQTGVDAADISPTVSSVTAQRRTVARIFGPPARLKAGESQANLEPYIRFAPNFSGKLTAENLADFADDAAFERTRISNYGSPGARFMLTVAVKNAGPETGSWQLFTKRAGLPELTFAELRNDQIEIIRDRDDSDLGEHLQTYHGFAHSFQLKAGETRYFIVLFRGVHSSSLPLRISDPATALKRQNFKIAAITASTASMLVLMLVATLFYLVTSGRHYLWLALAELNHAAFVVHVNGYSIHYLLHDTGIWIYSLGWVMPCLYGLAMVQFTRGLLDTAITLPRLDQMLKWLAILLAATLALIMIAAITSSEWLLSLAGYPVPVSLTIYTFGLPFVGIIAVNRLGKQYIPLLLAWTLMAVFSAYFTIALLDLGVTLPFDSYFYGPVGVIVSLLMTLTMVLHMRKVMADKQQSERDLITSLEARLQLSEEKASALATISDQDNLMHASGHDSQQVMLALNAIVDFAESDEELELPSVLTQTLKASVKQLDYIAQTGMRGPLSVGDSLSLVMLSRIELHDLFDQAELIYRPIIQKKGLVLNMPAKNDFILISDRAICARILSNLLNNCAKYTDRGSVTVDVIAEDSNILIEFRDTGCGMEQDFVDRLVKGENGRLRADERVEGSGSGFAAALKATRMLGGSIEVRSELGNGSNVLVRLPAISTVPECTVDAFIEDARTVGIDVINSDVPGVEVARAQSREIPVTGDPTAKNRNRLSASSSLALLKPVSLDMLEHPVLLASLESESHRPL